jgi:hypothetical protein
MRIDVLGRRMTVAGQSIVNFGNSGDFGNLAVQ